MPFLFTVDLFLMVYLEAYLVLQNEQSVKLTFWGVLKDNKPMICVPYVVILLFFPAFIQLLWITICFNSLAMQSRLDVYSLIAPSVITLVVIQASLGKSEFLRKGLYT
jgi:hypothetical protein